MKIFVSGLVNVETTLSVRGFPINYYPIDYPFFGVDSNVAGVGYNIAKALNTLGDEVSLISMLGDDDEAERILKCLKKDGLDSSGIVQALKRTPASVILYDEQGRRQIYCDLKDIQDHRLSYESVEDRIKACGMAVLCNIGFNREIIKRAKQAGVTTATDVHVLSDIEDEYNRDFMENADILFLSDEKLPCKAEDFIRLLSDRYHNNVIVIGMGDRGAMLYQSEGGEITMIPAYNCGKVINTVGAGDALFSAFIHFYLKTYNAKEALQKAVIFAGLKIAHNGASVGFSTESEIENIYKNL